MNTDFSYCGHNYFHGLVLRSIATGYGPDNQGEKFQSRQWYDYSLLYVVEIGSGAQPTSYPMVTGALSRG
jgi:hypothetical protein